MTRQTMLTVGAAALTVAVLAVAGATPDRPLTLEQRVEQDIQSGLAAARRALVIGERYAQHDYRLGEPGDVTERIECRRLDGIHSLGIGPAHVCVLNRRGVYPVPPARQQALQAANPAIRVDARDAASCLSPMRNRADAGDLVAEQVRYVGAPGCQTRASGESWIGLSQEARVSYTPIE